MNDGTTRASDRPLIGLTTYRSVATWGKWKRPAALLTATYVDAVERAGGVPVLLPPIEGGPGPAVRRLDGLVLTGGPDVAPERYGQDAHPLTEAHPERDAAEVAALEAALEADLPVLAVCRGLQLLHVACGGALVQHLPDAVGHGGHQPSTDAFARRDVSIAPGSRLAGLLGPSALTSCHHHQSVDGSAGGLQAVAWDADGTVEGAEMPERAFVVGVQWHPEEDLGDLRLFSALVQAAVVARQDRV